MPKEEKGEKKAKRGKGKPRTFKDGQEFLEKFQQYITHCKKSKRFPNVAGFCAYLLITRDTFYAQQEYYSDTYRIVNDILEDEVLQDNTYRAQLYLKNKFGYADKTETKAKVDLTYEEALKKVEGNEY